LKAVPQWPKLQRRKSAIDGRTPAIRVRHQSAPAKKVEEIFGWMKTVGISGRPGTEARTGWTLCSPSPPGVQPVESATLTAGGFSLTRRRRPDTAILQVTAIEGAIGPIYNEFARHRSQNRPQKESTLTAMFFQQPVRERFDQFSNSSLLRARDLWAMLPCLSMMK